VKKALVAGLALLGAWSCVTFAPAPPSFYIEPVPPAVVTRLSLDQRIAVDQAWSDLKEGRPDRARRALDKLGQDNPVYAAGMGYVNLSLGDLAAAESNFKDALGRSLEMTPARAGLAQLYQAKGEKELEFAQYRDILKTDPENRWAKPRYEALRSELTKGLLDQASSAKAAGRKAEAREALLKVLAVDPVSADANYLLGMLELEENDITNALRHLQAFIDQGPPSKERQKAVVRVLAERYFEKGEFGRSLDYYEKLAELEPEDKAVAARLEDLKSKLGVFELPSQYGIIASAEAITREDLAALIAVKFKDFLNGPERPTEIFVDIGTSWAQRFIIKIASLAIMRGYDNHTFQPRRIINRAELAESLAALIEFLKARGVRFVPLLDGRKIIIADVPSDSFYFQPIVRVVSYQVMDLTPERTFEPERTVSGREAVRTLDIVLGLAR
jgi:tetratricopeptide (TPR) repeat protein